MFFLCRNFRKPQIYLFCKKPLQSFFTVCRVRYNEAVYSAADIAVKFSSHPQTNYIMHRHTFLTMLPPHTACCSLFWEHNSSRFKNKVIPNPISPTLKGYSLHKSNNGNHAFGEMAIRLLHGRDGGLTCT